MIAILTRDFQRYSFFFQNKNTFGATVLYLYAPLILVINKSKKYKYYILNFLFLSLLFISGARSSFLVFFLYLILSPFLSSSIFKYFKCYFIGSIFLSLIFINSYINITDFANYEILNNISEETSGSQIASGRNVIWGKVMEYLHTNNLYLFGLGSGARLSDMFSGVGLSCHNLYIQILLQNGIIGLILFLTFIYLFFKVIKKKINVRDSIKINLFFFIYLLFIQQNFEVFFFQNNMLFMFIFALLLPLFNYKKTEIIVALSKKQSQNENDIPHSDKN
jgi:O-antigen ligase